MFGQGIQGHTSDPTGVRQAMDRRVRDLSPGAVGWVGITAGVTHDGEFIAVLQFDAEAAARATSDRREQDRWWADICAMLDGEVTVRNGMRTEVLLAGDLGEADFVQVVQGRVSDLDRARDRMHALQEALKVHLPALLGSVTVELGAGRLSRRPVRRTWHTVCRRRAAGGKEDHDAGAVGWPTARGAPRLSMQV